MTTVRPLPDNLNFENPPCSLCGLETIFDEGYACYGCGIWWDNNGESPEWIASWDDMSSEECSSVHPLHDDERCLLTAGHDLIHRGMWREWNDVGVAEGP